MYIHVTQFIAVFIATFSSISIGMQYGWSSPTVPKLMAIDSPIPITKTDTEWLDSIYMIGGIFGFPFTIYLSDKVGRKHLISSACVIYLISWSLIIYGTSVKYYYLARFLAGLGGNTSFVSLPMYIGEIAHKDIRGFLGSFIHIMVLIGITLVYTIAPLLPISTTAFVGIFFPIFQLVIFPIIPESPYYLLLIHEEEQAKKSLTFLRGFKNIDQELKEIKEAVGKQQSELGMVKDIFLTASNRKGLIIMMFLNASQNFGAVSVILMNLHTILADVEDIVSTYQVGIIFAAIMLISSAVGSILLDYFGRKNLMIMSCITTSTILFVIAIYFQLEKLKVLTRYSWIPAVAVVFYATAFQLGIGLIPLVLNGELFPTSVKALGMTLSDLSYVGFSIVSLKLYHVLVNNYGFHTPFYIFGGWCIFAAIFTAIYIPETKGRTLEEIQVLLKGKSTKKIKMEGERAMEVKYVKTIVI